MEDTRGHSRGIWGRERNLFFPLVRPLKVKVKTGKWRFEMRCEEELRSSEGCEAGEMRLQLAVCFGLACMGRGEDIAINSRSKNCAEMNE